MAIHWGAVCATVGCDLLPQGTLMNTNDGFVTAYTDISGNGHLWAYSYYVRCDQGVLTKADMIDVPVCDTNYAEMYAIVRVVKDILGRYDGINRILVVTDSRNAQNILWRGTDNEKYVDIVSQFRRLEDHVRVLIKWTKGHSGDDSDRTYLNNRCDKHSRGVVRDYLRKLRG